MTTIHDVAREAGVSISTVSYALTGKRSVSAATRARVEAAAKKLKYQPNAGARMLGGTRSQIFALTAPMRKDTNAQAHMSFVLAVVNEARKFDYDVLLLTEEEAFGGLSRVASTRLADCILLLDVTDDDDRVELVRNLATPSVVIGVPSNTDGLVCVDLDFAAAGDLAVRKLAEYGHRRIGLIGQAEETYSRGATFSTRLRSGVMSASEELGISTEFAFGDTTNGALRTKLDAMFSAADRPTALMLNCDEFGHKTVEAFLQNKGYAIPQDVSLVSVGASFNMEDLELPLDSIPLVANDSCARAVALAIESLDTPLSPRVELTEPKYRRLGTVGPVPR